MLRLRELEKQEIIRYLDSNKEFPEKYRFLLFDDKREVELVWNGKREIIRLRSKGASADESGEDIDGEWQEQWTGDYVFENEWQSFRTKKDRSLELISVAHECPPGRRKIAVKVVDIFGNDTMTIVEVSV
ncbi:MAG: hypothetical protein K0A93_00545 [Desulfuromonadaceae bacterium]|nr:hypothetical protein [Desulfuromonadaceae bacterium]